MSTTYEHPLFWLEQSAVDMPAGHEWLSEGERTDLSLLRFTRRRSSWRLGRWTAKRAIATRLEGLEPDDVEIRAAEDGAPEAFIAGLPAPLRVSISHSDSVSLCVVAPQTVLVGCDIETVEERGEMFARDYFVRSELARVLEERQDQRTIVETLVWSAKESALKALRDGLRRDTRDVIVDIGGTGGAREWVPVAIAVVDGTSPLFGWWRYEDGRVYTVATCRPCGPPVSLEAMPLTLQPES